MLDNKKWQSHNHVNTINIIDKLAFLFKTCLTFIYILFKRIYMKALHNLKFVAKSLMLSCIVASIANANVTLPLPPK